MDIQIPRSLAEGQKRRPSPQFRRRPNFTEEMSGPSPHSRNNFLRSFALACAVRLDSSLNSYSAVMSRQNGGARKGIKLPFVLQKELGIEATTRGRDRGGQRGSVRGRKEHRKAERVEKRQHGRGPKSKAQNGDTWQEFSEDDEDDTVQTTQTPKATQAQPDTKPGPRKPASILKRPIQPSPTLSEPSSPSSSRSSSME